MTTSEVPLTSTTSTHELLLALQRGQAQAIEVLYPRFVARFYSSARRRGLTHEEAEDAIHDWVDRLVERIASYRPDRVGPSAGNGWVWRIFGRLVTDALRRRGKELTGGDPDDGADDGPASGDPTPGQWVIEVEGVRCLQAAWQRLSAEDQAVLRGAGRRGPLADAWPAAAARFRVAVLACCGGLPDLPEVW